MSYSVQLVLDILHESAALEAELESLVSEYESGDTGGLLYSERKARMSQFTSSHARLEASLLTTIAASKLQISLLTESEVTALYDRLEADLSKSKFLVAAI